jgi:hypothetical protein
VDPDPKNITNEYVNNLRKILKLTQFNVVGGKNATKEKKK